MATGCDNVGWGGIDVTVDVPSDVAPAGSDSSSAAEARVEARPPRPVLLAGSLDGSRGSLTAVGELLDGALGELPDLDESPESLGYLRGLFSPGSEWILFSEGVRVGSLVADSVGVDTGHCAAPPMVSGWAEILPGASATPHLLALPAEDAAERPYGVYEVLEDQYNQRVAALNLAGEALPEVGAPWPSGGLLATRQDVRVFQVAGESMEHVATSFVYRDRLAVEPPGPAAYSLFILVSETPSGFTNAFTWYRPAAEQGKGAAALFDHLDWDGDGQEEALLNVYGDDSRWYAALERRGQTWVRTFQNRCGAPTPAPAS